MYLRFALERTWARLLVLILLGPLAGGLVAPMEPEARDRDGPVLWVHGFYPTLPAGMDYAVWEPAFHDFSRLGWSPDRMWAMGYYGCDRYSGDTVGYVDISAHGPADTDGDAGTSTAHDPSEHRGSGHGDNRCGEGVHGHGTSLAHQAWHWAWAADDVLDGRCGDVVAHSMAGLMVRHALMRIDAGDPTYPDPLCIDTVITLGTPHAGTDIAHLCAPSATSCRDLHPDSDFIAALERDGQHPGDGTWVVVASQADGVSSVASQTAMDADHVTVYHWSSGVGHSRLPAGNYLDHGLRTDLPTLEADGAMGRAHGPLLLADDAFSPGVSAGARPPV